MLKKILKIALFLLGFFIFSYLLAFVFKDDTNSYSRVLKHEFYNQEKIDYLICGASHVSHGIDCRIADKEFGKIFFNSGTPAQQIDGTYALLKEALSRYKIQKVFLEMDMGIITSPPAFLRSDSTADYIVLDFLRNPKIKFEFLAKITTPSNWLNSLLPIGSDKLMNLSPIKFFSKLKSLVTGQYFKYEYKTAGSSYAGKGCVLDDEKLQKGSLFATEFEETFSAEDICPQNIQNLDEIVEICKENGVELIFYSMPVTNFYLQIRQNYDDYINFMRKYAESHSCKYYDFNLCRESFLTLSDEDFSDDNHLNKTGIEKYTHAFCDFFTGKYTEKEFFYDSYKQKMSLTDPSVFGLVLIDDDAETGVKIIPLKNDFNEECISYDILAFYQNDWHLVAEKTSESSFLYPASGYGIFKIMCYVNGNLNCQLEKSYFAK